MTSIGDVRGQIERGKAKLAELDTSAIPSALGEAEAALVNVREQVAAALGAMAVAKQKLEEVQTAHAGAKATVDEARGLLSGATDGSRRRERFALNSAINGLRETVNDQRLGTGRSVSEVERIEQNLSLSSRAIDNLRGHVADTREAYSDHAAAVAEVNDKADAFTQGM